jgi:hypothetical protein
MENKFIDPLWEKLGINKEIKHGIAYRDCEHCKGTGHITIQTWQEDRYAKKIRNGRDWEYKKILVDEKVSCIHCELRYGLRSAILTKMNRILQQTSGMYHMGKKRMTQEQFINDPEGYELMKEYLSVLKQWWNRETEPGYKTIAGEHITEEQINLYYQFNDKFGLDNYSFGDVITWLPLSDFYSMDGTTGKIVKVNGKTLDVKIDGETRRVKLTEFLSNPVFLIDGYNKQIKLYQSKESTDNL